MLLCNHLITVLSMPSTVVMTYIVMIVIDSFLLTIKEVFCDISTVFSSCILGTVS